MLKSTKLFWNHLYHFPLLSNDDFPDFRLLMIWIRSLSESVITDF